jgi:hypothetical protein
LQNSHTGTEENHGNPSDNLIVTYFRIPAGTEENHGNPFDNLIVTYFRIPLQNSPTGTEENHGNPSDNLIVTYLGYHYKIHLQGLRKTMEVLLIPILCQTVKVSS